jgi:hypothetical protein
MLSFEPGVFDTLIYAGLLLLILVLLFDNIRIRLKNKGFVNEITQLNLNSMAYTEKIISLQDELSVIESDGFLKFISDSRETAFSYIEEVQLAIKELSEATESGKEEDINVAYHKLVGLLPEEKTSND